MADAQELADWDKHIRVKRRELLEMEANLNRVSPVFDVMLPVRTASHTTVDIMSRRLTAVVCSKRLQLQSGMSYYCTAFFSELLEG